MRYLMTPTRASLEAMMAGQLDALVAPADGYRVPPGIRFGADNGCYGKGWPGEERWLEWLARHPLDRCMFAVAPDVVGDAAATLARSTPWLDTIRDLGAPVAYAAQDGAEHPGLIPWADIDVLFIGGSTAWKLGPAARHLVATAKDRGMWVHMGRVNSARRIRYAHGIGCDSVDGTYVAFGPRKNLPHVLGWLRHVDQPTLWEDP